MAAIPLEIPPELKFGELSTPLAFELARKLRKAPKIIAQEIVSALGAVDGFASFEVAGAGYINARVDRGAGVRMVAATATGPLASTGIHSLVEHTSINPNKAAHVGHLRNAILGDTFVRLLRAAGQKVDVQNYIDNTGVQVADVVVGFLHLEGKSAAEVRTLILDCELRSKGSGSRTAGALYQGTTSVVPIPASDESGALAPAEAGRPFDYFCWDLYAKTSQWYDRRVRPGERSAEEAALRDAARDRARRQRDGGDCRTDFDGSAPAAS